MQCFMLKKQNVRMNDIHPLLEWGHRVILCDFLQTGNEKEAL
jgi:hypothetical protein